jgi:hypothetical protein
MPQRRNFPIQRHKPPQVHLHVLDPSQLLEPKASPTLGGMATTLRVALEKFQTLSVSFPSAREQKVYCLLLKTMPILKKQGKWLK